MKSKLWPSSEVKLLCQNRPFKNYAFCKFWLNLKICNQGTRRRGSQGNYGSSTFPETVLCRRRFLENLLSCHSSRHPKLNWFWQSQNLVGGLTIQIWDQYRNQAIKEIEQIQEKAFRIRSFKPKTEPSNPLFQNLKTIFKEILSCNDCIFGHG